MMITVGVFVDESGLIAVVSVIGGSVDVGEMFSVESTGRVESVIVLVGTSDAAVVDGEFSVDTESVIDII